MFLRLLLVFLILAALVGALAYMKFEQVTAQIAQFSQPMPPSTVSEVRVGSARWQPQLDAIGNVRAVQGVMVNNEVAGQVNAINFESGDRVSKGQALVQLDTTVDEADLAGLQASLQLAEIKLERNTKLLRDRAVSQGDFDETSAEVSRSRAAVAAKRALIEKKTIRAPFDGVLGIRQVDLGQYLSEGSSIVALEALDPVFVDYRLPERNLAKLAVGQPVQVRVAAYPERVFTGRVQAISPAVDQGTRNVQLRAELPNRDDLLRPGMFAKVATLMPQRDAVLTLPRRAVSFNTYGDSVFVIEEQPAGAGEAAAADTGQGTKLVVNRRQITTGDVRGDLVEVRAGLAEGDRVVLAGHQKLRNGVEVQIVPDDGPAADGAPAAAEAPELAPQTSRDNRQAAGRDES
ncbi:efflux RND transporter periplasmic adaptor subunit [Thiohalocapsa sp. ML1]|jgi:membrane fusion protein, multidrug efflux system|uniref:efflux RND transporter periplasmic adaptor subunit n=1 Tax=Thiohalocapsa sp. ML1 TaxID=1431688 RepID=UPI0007320339|nr:efflux RND transporter periplasmic adaptor subunit [Thiohalocapsa sp. ML1]